MNPLTNVRNIQKLNETELKLGIIGKKSWHDQYKDSAWIFIGGLPYDLTEGDILAVFSQYGEIVNLNLIRDKQTGKSKGYGFLCYEDQRSTVLAVDNLNSIKVLGRTIRVDHVEAYKKPKEHENDDEITKLIRKEGCAPAVQSRLDDDTQPKPPKVKKEKHKNKKKKKEKKKIKLEHSSSSADESESSSRRNHGNIDIKIKHEKHDSGYEKALNENDKARRAASKTDLGSHTTTNHPEHDRRAESRRDVDRERKRETDAAYEFENKRQKSSKPSQYEEQYREDSRLCDRDADRQQDISHRQQDLDRPRDRDRHTDTGRDRDRHRDRSGDSDRHRYERMGRPDSDRKQNSHRGGRR